MATTISTAVKMGFTDAAAGKKLISVSNADPTVEDITVNASMNTILTNSVFNNNGEDLTSKDYAKVVTTTEKDVVLA